MAEESRNACSGWIDDVGLGGTADCRVSVDLVSAAAALLMSTKHVRTAFDMVRFKLGLSVTCRACGHTLTIAGHELAREIGQLALSELQPRLKCSACAEKNVEMKLLHPPSRAP